MRYRTKHKITRELTRMILTEFPETRDSDVRLIKRFYQIASNKTYQDYSNMRVNEFFAMLCTLPSFESVTRARRYLQKHNEELRASDAVNDERAILEEEFREEYGVK